jgi:hypothetical protein
MRLMVTMGFQSFPSVSRVWIMTTTLAGVKSGITFGSGIADSIEEESDCNSHSLGVVWI